MERECIVFISILVIGMLSIGFVSAGFFSDTSEKITGKAIVDGDCEGADIDEDGKVTLKDYILLKRNFECDMSDPLCSKVDINNDGNVDIEDYDILKENYDREDCGDETMDISSDSTEGSLPTEKLGFFKRVGVFFKNLF